MDAIRIARAYTGRDTVMKIFGSYHGHHDTVMVSIGVEYDKIGDRENYASLPYGAGIPQAVVDMTIAVPFNDAAAMERRIERLAAEGRLPACVIMEAAMMNLGVVLPEPGYLEAVREITQPARHRPDLRRGQDRPGDRPRRRDREVRRDARHGHAGEGARRRHCRSARSAATTRSCRSSRTAPSTRWAPTTGTRSAWPPRARTCSRSSPPRPTSISTTSTTASSRAASGVIEKHNLPGYAVGIGSKGCVTFSTQKIVDYESFKANQDADAVRAGLALQHEPRRLHDAGPRGGVDPLGHARRRLRRPLRRRSSRRWRRS